MRKIIAIFLLFPVFLSSCGTTTDNTVVNVEKTPFLIQTYILWKKVESFSVEKSARLTAGSSITLVADSAWEVTTLWAKEGQKIKKWTTLISLKDTVNSYDIRLAQAENALTIQDSNIASTRLSLDKAISDTQIAYEQAKKGYDLLLEKNKLIYDTLVNTNNKTLESYNENYKSYLIGVETLMNNFLYEWDKIMGMTSAFQYTVDGWKPYLWAKVWNLYSQSSNEWNNTYSSRGDVRAKRESGGTLTVATIQSDLDVITNAYSRLQKYVDSMISMIQNNVVWGGLSQIAQDGWVVLWNGIKTQLNASEWAYNGWKSQSLSFFKNYKNGEIATKLAIESLTRSLTAAESGSLMASDDMRLIYENTRLDLKDKIKSAELALKQAQSARDTTRKNKDLALNQLSATRASSSLSLDQAKREYSKLAVTAPFDGTVTKVIASVGQRTNIGSPMIEIASNVPEIVLDVDNEIATNISNGDTVTVKMDAKTFTGTIIAISRTAGANLLYTTRISVPTAIGSLWSAVSVIFSLSKETISADAWKWVILPLKSVKIISEQEWEIALLGSWNTLIYKSIRLGNVTGEGVEVLDTLDPKLEIVLSDVSNYDATKYTLTKKN